MYVCIAVWRLVSVVAFLRGTESRNFGCVELHLIIRECPEHRGKTP
jgi:hypothetical protein